MPIDAWLAFVAAAVVVLVIPGPTILTVLSYSLSHGRRANVPVIAGVALGDSTALVGSLFGLGGLLAASAFWFNVVRIVGGVCLLLLGFRMLTAAARPPRLEAVPAPESPWTLFANTYAVTALNPKGIVFYVVFVPQFIDTRRDVTLQLVVVAVTFVVLATLNASLYALFASRVRGLLASPVAQRGFNAAGGSLLSGAGLWALVARRAA